jgi:hypothetical protein
MWMKSSGIEPATFQLVAQCLNQLRPQPPLNNFLNPPLRRADHLPPSSVEVKEYPLVAWCLITHNYNLPLRLSVLRHKCQVWYSRSFWLYACLYVKVRCWCGDGQTLNPKADWRSGDRQHARVGVADKQAGLCACRMCPKGRWLSENGHMFVISFARSSELCCRIRRCKSGAEACLIVWCVVCVCGDRRVTWTSPIKECPPQRPTLGGSL